MKVAQSFLRPGLRSPAVAWPPRLSAGRKESGSQCPWLVFEAASLLLWGDAGLSLELRARTVVALHQK